jgi:ubiquinone/menaquinone biosynthesis C-methylase UbiE
MNYGYMPADALPFSLSEQDEPDRAFIGLYEQAVFGLDLDGKRVLEVGCGRGGGASFVARYCNPSEFVATDYSRATVGIAKKLNRNVPNLSFQFGDAEALPFGDNEFDVIINIESSHCYSNMPAFATEVERVLKPNGMLTWADMRGLGMMAEVNRSFDDAGLQLVSEQSLASGVVNALAHMSDRKARVISRFPIGRRFMTEFAAIKDTKLYSGLKSGTVLYIGRRYQKM